MERVTNESMQAVVKLADKEVARKLSKELDGACRCLHDWHPIAPCLGRCEQAPVAVVLQYPVPLATLDEV